MCIDDLINIGEFIILRREQYTKLFKLKEPDGGTVTIGNYNVRMQNALNQPYGSVFEMQPDNDGSMAKKIYNLCVIGTHTRNSSAAPIWNGCCGTDNQAISDTNSSQQLSREQIEALKNDPQSTHHIVSQLISNSSTFGTKTEYSQEKYVRKKTSKHWQYLQIVRPTIRLLTQLYHRQDAAQLQEQHIGQVLAYANVQAGGNYLLYDCGTNGLMAAAILNAMGNVSQSKIATQSDACLIHMHPGNECQKGAINAMQFGRERLYRQLINVNIYSVLRHYYQQKNDDEPPAEKKVKRETLDTDPPAVPVWHLENERACQVLKLNAMDSLIVILMKDHPGKLVKELLQFLHGNRSFVVYHALREPLVELFTECKQRTDIINIHLLESAVRYYQVLPDRTHPHVTMNSGGGFLLTGYKLVT